MASAGTLPGYWQVLSATFDAGQGPNEAHLSGGDSGGGVFILDGSTWELAGINFAVDGYFSSLTPGGPDWIGAMFDQNGLYDAFTGSAFSGPGSFYATHISSYQDWIDTTAAVPEPTTMIAGALLLLPFGASTLRVLRRKQAA